MIKSKKNIIVTFAIGCIVYLIGNLWFGNFNYQSVNDFLIDFIFYQLYAFILGYSNMAYFQFLSTRNWKNNQQILRLVIGFVGASLITLLGLFVIHAVTRLVYQGLSFSEFLASERLSDYIFGFWITMSIVVVFHIVYYYNAYQQKKLKEQKVIAGTASAQFESLKNQIDPHFLFNSLNVLTSLIEENPDSAQRFTVSLSKIYRYVLDQKDKELVTVAEELRFAKTYMNLLKMRFENSIVFQLPEDYDQPEAKVVPLSLQLLLENTIKHNTVSEQKPLEITITIEDNVLVVKNNLQKKEVLQTRKGVGLQNIVNRYAILTNRKVLVDETPEYFAVKIPILTKRISIMEPTKHQYNEQDAYYRAKKRVEEIKGFYGNLISYCVVIPVLIFINYKTFWGYQWFWYPMLGWGMGLVFHAISVFGYGKSWEERKIQEILKKNEKQQKNWD
ncbi:histidine kinase [Formosa sediminum]|uniref:Histidine kinase n=1 Tax=Formosa sediminum TaxID=2594004 RepID=A0A516GS49_9FLAO|nr:2TM domain-containing protein [Formosa sediminum]QDO94344.1 histidine kinase [Formosa sediminum]